MSNNNLFLGIDTSNYATSVAVYDANSNSPLLMLKQFLEVKENSIGLRQSDAVFLHIKNFPKLFSKLCDKIDMSDIKAVGVSAKPRDGEKSYMPCFVAGKSFAETIANSLRVECFEFTHQLGHIAAAAFDAKVSLDEFFCFHVSGGTTDLLFCSDFNDIDKRKINQKACSLDLYAGQLVDRIGAKLGFDFPCGPEVSAAALLCHDDIKILKPFIKDGSCSLSGIENRCIKLLEQGKTKQYVSKFCLLSIADAVIEMTKFINKDNIPVVFAGGVMCSETIKERIMKSGISAYFAGPSFSADNAFGVAVLAFKSYNKI